MIDPRNRVALVVEGREFDGWKKVDIQTGIERGAGAFRLELTEKWPGAQRRPIHKEDACTLLIGTQVVITGQVDEVERTLGEDGLLIAVTGRDSTGELIDCAAMNTPGEWKDRRLEDIAGDICAPFGIKVRVATSTGKPFPTFTLQKGEKAWDAIKRLCAARGVLPYSDGVGGLVIGPGNPARVGTELVEGKNVKFGASGKDSRIGRYRDYHVLAQSGLWGDAQQNAGTSAVAHDSGIRRYRPTMRLADDLADGVTAADQAHWEARVGKAKANTATIPVAGWWHGGFAVNSMSGGPSPAGGLWRPNTLVPVRCPSIEVEGDRLIAAVQHTIDLDGGTVTRLSLVGAGAFDVLAEKEKGGAAW